MRQSAPTSKARSLIRTSTPSRTIMGESIFAASRMQYLSRGHAVQCERNYILDEDLGVAIRVALSSAYRERVDLFRALLQNNGVLNTDEVMQVLNVRRQTALNSMRELELVGLVEDEQQEADTKPYSAIRLKKVFSWLLSKEYEKYWEA